MTIDRRAFAALAASLALAPAARAQTAWPTRPVRWILPFGAGSGVDVGARLLSDKLGALWGQPLIVDNRPGGDGIIAMTAFLNANDDHVLLFCGTGSYTVHPYTTANLPYDIDRDLTPIARVATTVMGFATPTSMKIASLKDFVALARANPGKLNAAVPQGISEVVFDGFLKTENLDIQKVPYKDVVQAVPDLVEGRINVIYSSYATVRPATLAGGASLLAVGTRDRVADLPNTPTTREAGVPSLELDGLSGLFGPAKMPLELRRKIGADIVEVMKDKTILARMSQSGQTPAPGGPEDFGASVRAQIDQVDGIAKLLGMPRK
jgi:tripartite-type tricarboxylate transporter receptor subunit TctC